MKVFIAFILLSFLIGNFTKLSAFRRTIALFIVGLLICVLYYYFGKA